MQSSLLLNSSLEGSAGIRQFEKILHSKLEIGFGRLSYTSWLRDISVVEISHKMDIIIFIKKESHEWLLKDDIDKYNFDKFCKVVNRTFESYYDKLPNSIKITDVQQEGLFEQAAEAGDGKIVKLQIKNTGIAGDISIALNPKFSFETFIFGTTNEIAYRTVKAFISDSNDFGNMLSVYGAIGNGKTHLLQAAAIYYSKLGKRVLYVPSEKFMLSYIEAIRANMIVEFRKTFNGVDLLVIDDIHFILGKTKK